MFLSGLRKGRNWPIISGVSKPTWLGYVLQGDLLSQRLPNFRVIFLGQTLRSVSSFIQFLPNMAMVMDFLTGARELGFQPAFLYTPKNLIN